MDEDNNVIIEQDPDDVDRINIIDIECLDEEEEGE